MQCTFDIYAFRRCVLALSSSSSACQGRARPQYECSNKYKRHSQGLIVTELSPFQHKPEGHTRHDASRQGKHDAVDCLLLICLILISSTLLGKVQPQRSDSCTQRLTQSSEDDRV